MTSTCLKEVYETLPILTLVLPDLKEKKDAKLAKKGKEKASDDKFATIAPVKFCQQRKRGLTRGVAKPPPLTTTNVYINAECEWG